MDMTTENKLGVLDAYLGYIEAIYFTETGDIDQPESDAEMSRSSKITCANDVDSFLQKVQQAGLLEPYLEGDDTSWPQLGHDFWLTRNNHGAGFWDRGLGEIGEKLTEIAQSFKECHVEQGDDGFLYVR
jgi:hypothetical protein